MLKTTRKDQVSLPACICYARIQRVYMGLVTIIANRFEVLNERLLHHGCYYSICYLLCGTATPRSHILASLRLASYSPCDREESLLLNL